MKRKFTLLASMMLVALCGVFAQDYALKISNSEIPENGGFWSVQVAYDLDEALENGGVYQVSFLGKAPSDAGILGEVQGNGVQADGWWFGLGTDWTKITQILNISSENKDKFVFLTGNHIGSILIDDMELRKLEKASDTEGGYALHVNRPFFPPRNDDGSFGGGYWDVQSAYRLPDIDGEAQYFELDAEYELKFAIKAIGEHHEGKSSCSIPIEVQSPHYGEGSDLYEWVAISDSWTEHTLTYTITKENRCNIIISYGDFKGDVYIDNVSIRKINEDGSRGEELVANGDFEEGHADGWGGWDNTKVVEGEEEVERTTFKISEEGKGVVSVGEIIALDNLISNNDFEDGTINGWYVKDGGNTAQVEISDSGEGYVDNGGGLVYIQNIQNNLDIYASKGNICFKATAGASVEIYTVLGIKTYHGIACEGLNTIPQSDKGTYIVKIGNTTNKVLVQ